MESLKKFALEVLKEIDYKKILYKGWKEVIKPKLEKYVADTESKWDDVMLEGLDKIASSFLNKSA